jgi:putative pyruvate formate lyase activating enzyme
VGRLPSYTYLAEDEWDRRIAHLEGIARSCTLCPRSCNVDRIAGEKGFCGAPAGVVVSSIFPHHGEEPPLSGSGGSGTVFFTFCTLKCVFCQNYQLSHLGEGDALSVDDLAYKMVALQNKGCHNINLVTATHFLPWLLRALKTAARAGLSIPIVYNCGGYERPEVMALLSGIVDMYLPDMKYGSDGPAAVYSNARDYVAVNRAAIREMFRQVGPLRMDDSGIAYRGMCIRHLVLPDNRAGTREILDFLKSSFDPHDISISLMAQYKPLFKAAEFPEIARRVTFEEYEPLRTAFIENGFQGFYQEIERMDHRFVIDFKKRKSERLTGED